MATTTLPKISPSETPLTSPPSPDKSVHSRVCSPPKISTVETPILTPSSPDRSSNSRMCSPPKIGIPTGLMKPRTLNHLPMPSVYEPYPPRLITTVDDVDFSRVPGRVNALHPPPPQRRTVMWETVDPHDDNSSRSNLMQKMHRSRYHTAYQTWAYGSPAEKEVYRRIMREGLKQQMTDREHHMRHTFDSRVRESEIAVQKDRDDIVKDAQDHYNHHNQMKTFRDANKSQMEENWNWRRRDRYMNWRHEAELLKYNPINWSCSMK